VHAHPDDESSKGAASVAYYSAQGVRCVLVSCTDGEAGDAPADFGDRSLAEVRAAELREAVAILGYDTTHSLGYRDSGMDGSVVDGFATAPLRQIVDELVDLFRTERPDVVVTYDAEYAGRHPDHRRSHEAAVLAFDCAAIDGWRPLKLYGCRTHSPQRLRAMHTWLNNEARESPYANALASAEAAPDQTTTRIDVANELETARRALAAHRSQVPADDPWFFSVPVETMRRIYPYEDYVRIRSHVRVATDGAYETDLFAGIDGSITR
jgi:mycothiol S-conjugate amidase